MTKSQVNKLGKALKKSIKDECTPEDDLLNSLQEYRTSFKEDISIIFESITEIAKSIRKDSITSFRIKRIESILSKIKRQPTMALGNMGDIAGCRIIVYNKNIIRRIIEAIESQFEVQGFNDYLEIPKEDGYRGYHLYVKSPVNSTRLVEIQIRSMEGHQWSSMVEIIDVLYDLKIKEGQKHAEFQKFHLLFSKKDELNLSEKLDIIEIDQKNKVHSKLNEVFIKNHTRIRSEWFDLMKKNNSYFIIEVDSDKASEITSFENYEVAELEYFKKFKERRNSYFVLTKIEKPNFKRLCVAYASYVLTKHDYMNFWIKATGDILDLTAKSGDEKAFTAIRKYTRHNLKEQMKLLEEEAQAMRKLESSDNNIGLDEWIQEIKERLEEIGGIAIKQTKSAKEKGFLNKLFK